MDLETLCQIPALSGDEYELHDYLENHYKKQGLAIAKDKLGSVFGESLVHESPFKVMISANLDENGGMVQELRKDGLLDFVTIGLYQKADFLNQRICLLKRHHERVYGYVLKKGEDYLLDIGARSLAELKDWQIQIGDTFVLDIPARLNESGFLLSKNIANRVGLYLSQQIMSEVQGSLPYDLVIGGISQSLVGTRGAITATNRIKPDLALVFDAASVEDYQEKTLYLRHFDKTLLPNLKLLATLKKVALANGFQVKAQIQDTGTDGAFIHKTRIGAPTVVVVIPLQHSNSFVQSIHIDDLDPIRTSIVAFLRLLNEQMLTEMAFQDRIGDGDENSH